MTDSVQLGSLDALVQSLTLPNGLVLDEVRIEIGAASATLNPFALDLDRPGTFEVRVSADSVKSFLELQGVGGMKDVSVTAEGGRISVQGTVRVLVEIRVTATCVLRIEDGKKLFVEIQDLSVPGGMARNLVESQLEKVNPILDLTTAPIDVDLKTSDASDGYVIVSGSASWPQRR